MFIKANDKYINLANVSSINILKNRIAFDFNTSVELDNGKHISYYAYYDGDAEEFFRNLETMEFIKQNYIKILDNGSTKGLVNKSSICAIKFIEGTRCVFNLSHSTTSTGFDEKTRLTSKFIYVDFGHKKEFEAYKIYVLNKIEGVQNGN